MGILKSWTNSRNVEAALYLQGVVSRPRNSVVEYMLTWNWKYTVLLHLCNVNDGFRSNLCQLSQLPRVLTFYSSLSTIQISPMSICRASRAGLQGERFPCIQWVSVTGNYSQQFFHAQNFACDFFFATCSLSVSFQTNSTHSHLMIWAIVMLLLRVSLCRQWICTAGMNPENLITSSPLSAVLP